ncbi:MAG: FecR domain-containing protein [Ferruginibacter sp.]
MQMANRQLIEHLIKVTIAQTATAEDLDQLIQLLREEENGEATAMIHELLGVEQVAGRAPLTAKAVESMAGNILQTDKPVTFDASLKPAQVISLWKKIVGVAAAAILTGISIYFFTQPGKQVLTTIATISTNDIKAPATNRATVTLANGQVIYLDSAANGTLATQGSISLIKAADGAIAYKTDSLNYSAVDDGNNLNTLRNPRGSNAISITLSDGTKVWLNAASSLTYPTIFAGPQRKVIINGEAYFEVAHNEVKPFLVSKGAMQITVLGTHFNVNAYDDEKNIKTTLLEGSVKVSTGATNKIIKPGQQAIVSDEAVVDAATNHNNNAAGIIITQPSIDEVMAWKNGIFKFQGASIQTLMRQIEKWYDVQIVYEGTISKHFIATIPRTVSAANVFKILEATGDVQFKIEGKKVTVSP